MSTQSSAVRGVPSPPTSHPGRSGVDPRGQRFAAGLTVVVLAAALLALGRPAAVVLLAWQTFVFATGALRSPAATPYAWLFRRLVRPRLGPPASTEDEAPPRFAQAVGLGFGVVAVAALVVGSEPVAALAAGGALAAAFLNAAFGICLGCEIYLRLAPVRPSRPIRRPTGPRSTPDVMSTTTPNRRA